MEEDKLYKIKELEIGSYYPKGTIFISPLRVIIPVCCDDPDTHVWSDDYKEIENGQTRYCKLCGLTAMEHSLRIGL